MTDDVFNVHDRVVHQDPDGKDQREKRDAVQGESEKIKSRERQRQRHRDRDRHHAGLAPPERPCDQKAHAEHRDGHMEKQLVGFFFRGFSVIARHGHFNVLRKRSLRKLFDRMQDHFRQMRRVGPFSFGNGQRHGLERPFFFAAGRRAEKYLRGPLFLVRPIDNLSDIAELHHASRAHSHHEVFKIRSGTEKRVGFDMFHLRNAFQMAGILFDVRGPDDPGDFRRIQQPGLQFLFVKKDLELPLAASVNMRFRNIWDRVDDILDAGNRSAKRDRIPFGTVKCEGQDGDIIDRPHFNERLCRTQRKKIEIGVNFGVKLDQAFFDILPHLEPHNDHRAFGFDR